MYLNKSFIIGNLTRDPELKALPSGTKVCSMSIATNSTYKDKDGNKKEQVEFHNVVVFGQVAENCASYLKKGQSALVEGRIQTRSWDHEGIKKYRTEIIADRVQFGPKRGTEAPQSEEAEVDAVTGAVRPAVRKNTQTPAVVPAGKKTEPGQIEYPEEEINPDDIPF